MSLYKAYILSHSTYTVRLHRRLAPKLYENEMSGQHVSHLYDNVRIHYQKQKPFPCYKTEGFKTSVMHFPGAPTLNLGANSQEEAGAAIFSCATS